MVYSRFNPILYSSFLSCPCINHARPLPLLVVLSVSLLPSSGVAFFSLPPPFVLRFVCLPLTDVLIPLLRASRVFVCLFFPHGVVVWIHHSLCQVVTVRV